MKLVIPAPGPSRGRLFLYTRRGLAGNYRQRSLVSKGLLCYRVFFRDPSLTAGIPKGLTMENPDDIGLFGVASERAATPYKGKTKHLGAYVAVRLLTS